MAKMESRNRGRWRRVVVGQGGRWRKDASSPAWLEPLLVVLHRGPPSSGHCSPHAFPRGYVLIRKSAQYREGHGSVLRVTGRMCSACRFDIKNGFQFQSLSHPNSGHRCYLMSIPIPEPQCIHPNLVSWVFKTLKKILNSFQLSNV
jgi:hypothetical protein